jgi:hypothetical protein
MMKKPSKTFIRYLISYTVCYVLPLLLLLTVMNGYFSRVYKDEALSNMMKITEGFKNNIDLVTSQVNFIASQLLVEEEFQNPSFNQNPTNQIRTVKKLSMICTSNPFLSNIILCQNDFFITSDGVYRNKFL